MDNLLFIGNLGTGEIIIIALIVLLLFGGKKIPELMKGLGKGVKNFKDGVKGLEEDIKVDDTENKGKAINGDNNPFIDGGREWRKFLNFCKERALKIIQTNKLEIEYK